MHMRNRRRTRGLPPGLFSAAAVLGAGFAVSLIATAGVVTPEVGDMIVFTQDKAPASEAGARIAVHRPDQFGCILDLDTMHKSGGSLIVEARLAQPAPSFRLHWAGKRTSADSGDCGTSADMILGQSDLDGLARAAGGHASVAHPMPVLTSADAR
jgi:hypothetical protein